jgi:hypothetical protein
MKRTAEQTQQGVNEIELLRRIDDLEYQMCQVILQVARLSKLKK